MTKYKVTFDREGCIGALACSAIAPEIWLLASDGKVDLKEGIYNEKTKKYELVLENIDESKIAEIKDSAEHCPVNVIKVFKIEDDGEEVQIV